MCLTVDQHTTRLHMGVQLLVYAAFCLCGTTSPCTLARAFFTGPLQSPAHHSPAWAPTKWPLLMACGCTPGTRLITDVTPLPLPLPRPHRTTSESQPNKTKLLPVSMAAATGGRPGPVLVCDTPAPSPPPRVLKDSGVGAMAPTAPIFLSHA